MAGVAEVAAGLLQNVQNTKQLEGWRFTVVVVLPEDVPGRRVHDLPDAIVADMTADGTLGGRVQSTTADTPPEIARDPSSGASGGAWQLEFPVTAYWLIDKVPNKRE